MTSPYLSIRDFELADKVVFLRLDLNTPLKDGEVSDDTRIRAALPTLRYAMENGAKVVVASHLGRPKSAEQREFSLAPVAQRLGELMSIEVLLIDEPLSDSPKGLLAGLKSNQIIMLENLRFLPGETKNTEDLARAVVRYADIYINDAFGACHRAHASIVSLAEHIPKRGIGFLIEKEIEMLTGLVDNPASPFVAILGGAKVSDKIDVIEKIIDKVDGFIIGGAMAYTFLKAMGKPVGASLLEQDKVKFAEDLMKRLEARDKNLLLPVDHVVVDSFSDPQFVETAEMIHEDRLGVDIGPKSCELFGQLIARSKTVFWNGPMGIFEDERFSKGTFAVAKHVADSSAQSIVGGGDSAAAANLSGLADRFSHISTGGGASLEFLQGKLLPGLQALKKKKTSESV